MPDYPTQQASDRSFRIEKLKFWKIPKQLVAIQNYQGLSYGWAKFGNLSFPNQKLVF
ncbi:hypothetical protein [Nostoc sp.]|uniref:hypothetical protein n=1 Tax=Nostoc sp. TaxID=1180 RepID=UPI002FF556C7